MGSLPPARAQAGPGEADANGQWQQGAAVIKIEDPTLGGFTFASIFRNLLSIVYKTLQNKC